MKDKLQKLKEEILAQIGKAGSEEVLRDLEIKYLGRKGALTEILRGLKDLDKDERENVGQLANEIIKEVLDEFAELRKKFLKNSGVESFIDRTLPGQEIKRGHLHPITVIQNEFEDLFTSMGFMVLDGPELESDYYNFEAVNVPKDHPARDIQDTFYIDKKNREGESDLVLRTQTSSVQVRAMREYGAPLRCIIPGRCFRSEATDVRHEHTFYQIEGIMIDKNINLSNMKAVLETVAKKLFGPETKLRLRPKFYPFVEPGANGEVTCFLCHGQGCRLCKNTGWLEILGCGMVHPEVLKNGGLDPKIYSGFAFGFGFSRLVMLKYGIDDVRLFNSGDLRFLEQF